MMSARYLTLSVAAFSLLLSSCGSKSQNASSDAIEVKGAGANRPAGPAPEEVHGQEFVSAVLGDYDFALTSATAAAANASRADVKQFAAKLQSDLSGSRNRLAQVASSAGLKAEPDQSEHRTEVALVTTAHGAAIEKLFVDQQIENLSNLVGLLRAYKNGGDNDALKVWAKAEQSLVNDRLLDLQTVNAEIQEQADQANSTTR